MCAEERRRNWKMRVQDILDAISKIQTYTARLTLDQFRNDTLRVDAVIRNLEVIGEAAGHIPLEIQEKYPEIAWFEMRGMRNLMVHEYFGVSIPIIWQTIRNDLVPLAENMEQISKRAGVEKPYLSHNGKVSTLISRYGFPADVLTSRSSSTTIFPATKGRNCFNNCLAIDPSPASLYAPNVK